MQQFFWVAVHYIDHRYALLTISLMLCAYGMILKELSQNWATLRCMARQIGSLIQDSGFGRIICIGNESNEVHHIYQHSYSSTLYLCKSKLYNQNTLLHLQTIYFNLLGNCVIYNVFWMLLMQKAAAQVMVILQRLESKPLDFLLFKYNFKNKENRKSKLWELFWCSWHHI